MPHALKHLEHFVWLLVNSKDFWNATIGTVFGAFIGGLMAVWSALSAQKQAAKDQRERDAAADLSAVNGTLRAIAAELKVFKSENLDYLQKTLEARDKERREFSREPEPLAMIPADPNRFLVFQAGCGMLGKIEDDDLPERIVEAYSRAKSLIERHNIAAQFFENWRHLPDGNSEKALLKGLLEELEQMLLAGLPKLRRKVDDVLEGIDRYVKARLKQ